MAASLPHIFRQLKSRSAGSLLTRSIKMSVSLEQENVNVYSLRTMYIYSSNRQGGSGLLTSRCVLLSYFDSTSIRQISSLDKYLWTLELESNGLTRKQAESYAEIITKALTEQENENKRNLQQLENKMENENKRNLQQLENKMKTEIEIMKIKFNGLEDIMNIRFNKKY